MKKVLIANRGEIAVRIIRACHDLGLQTVAVYSQADAEALHVLHADEAICIGEAASKDSYLKIPHILSAGEISGADAIHPGYGFLSENANFASICESCGLSFIGPSPEAISLLGDKIQAKRIAKKANCPIIPGSEGIIHDPEEGLKMAKEMGFPVFIKATAGGGGKGIRVATKAEEFIRLFIAAQREAELGFNNPDVYLEKMICEPRHVEVQILGDEHGNYVHLGERDCTIQRRRQKLIEESPSPILKPEVREKMQLAAVSIAKTAGYSSAGTVEFLVDKNNDFYFLEMNTRIQVEHTVSEMLTGIDLVIEQLRVSMGEKLRFKQSDIIFTGHAMELRINSEDPHNNFAPCPGLVEYYLPPGGPGVRVDSAIYSGYRVPPYYDSMIAKLIVHGTDRAHAIRVAKRALAEFHIGGLHTTIPFHQFMMDNKRFINNDYDLHFLDELIDEGCTFEMNQTDES